ncbi:MAG: peptidoglycan-associated lipoprotein Pal [Candidatus Omnitrophota bacterium]|nr:MAG: peptidoglycan-associated lipoprotein Pal [Candidatus Omnitrophota bacterium]
MKYIKVVLILTVVGFFAGCQCPQKRRAEKIKKHEEAKKVPEIQEIIKEIEKPVEKPKVTEKKEETPIVKKGEVPPEKLPPEKEIKKAGGELTKIFKNIYFDFDKYNLKEDAIKTLKEIGNYLRKHSDVKILIEGHCDERGTREYNLVLGEQRALSARNFLINYGISPKRIYTVSYGEDKPADPRHCEEAWAKNRRCEFKIVSE